MNVQHTTVVKSYTTVVSVKRRDLVAVTNGATVEDRRITGGDDVTTQTFKALERGGGALKSMTPDRVPSVPCTVEMCGQEISDE